MSALHVDGSAWREVLLGPPVRLVVADPVPHASDGGFGGHAQSLLGGDPVGDRVVEVRHDDHADAVRVAVDDGEARGGVEVDVGQAVRRQGGEARRLTRRHAAGPAGGDGHGVGAPVAELFGRVPALLVGCEGAGDRRAPVVDHLDVVDGSAEGGDGYRGGGVDVGGLRTREDAERGGKRRRRRSGRATVFAALATWHCVWQWCDRSHVPGK